MKLATPKGVCRVLGVGVLAVGYLPTFLGVFRCEVSDVSRKSSAVVCGGSQNILERGLQVSGIADGSFLMALPSSTDGFLSEMLNIRCGELGTDNDGRVAEKVRTVAEDVSVPKVIRHGKFANSKVVKGTVKFSFYVDAGRAGIPARVVDSIIANLSGSVNFRRSIKRGNKFEVMFDQKRRLVYCGMEIGRGNKDRVSVYGIEENGKMVYYRDNGIKVNQSASKSFGRPLPGQMVVSSPYGMRVHPVRGIRCYHSGVDLKASYGTPVYAIMDGVVVRASSYSGYGNCVEITHSSGYKSLYGHLSRYAVRYGSRVKKGQVIGYSGSTGVSTGPHLHLELARYNRVINPFSVKLLPNEDGRIKNMRAFENYKIQIKNATK